MESVRGERAMSGVLAPGLYRKLKKVLDCRTDSPDLLASINALSTFYTDNSNLARRSLRLNIEKRILSINHEFLLASEAVQQTLNRAEDEVNTLDSCCDKVGNALTTSSMVTSDVFIMAERLRQELEATLQKKEVVSRFLSDYQLSPEEVNALRGEEMDEPFFKALSHTQEIHKNCKLLLRTHHQRAGLELMDMMAMYQEGAYERLCRWVQAECKRLGDNDNPGVSELLKAAMGCLKERPVLFKYCIEELASTRHHALFRRFLTALTRGGPGGLPRPIEVHAHDPLRYVGDMLGWLHQALASERELALTLLLPDVVDSILIHQCSRTFMKNNSMEMEPTVSLILDRIFEGVCRPLNSRVEQAVQSQPNLIVSYKLSNTLQFYCHTISDLLGRDSALCHTLWLLKGTAERAFFDILKARGDKILRYPALVSGDLLVPAAVREGMSILLEIIDIYNNMMVSVSGHKPEFDPVINAFLDPLIQMCELAAEAYKSKGNPKKWRMIAGQEENGTLSKDTAISSDSHFVAMENTLETPSIMFTINCLTAIRQPLLGLDVAANYVKKLSSLIELHLENLVEREVGVVMRRTGLMDRVSLIRHTMASDNNEKQPLAHVDEMSPSVLVDCIRAFLEIISGYGGASSTQFQKLQLPSLQSEAYLRMARALADAYELIHNAVVDPKNQYSDPRSLLKHAPDQVRTILGI